eukprot:6208525-Pleurochrysis_carterae.AAC.1
MNLRLPWTLACGPVLKPGSGGWHAALAAPSTSSPSTGSSARRGCNRLGSTLDTGDALRALGRGQLLSASDFANVTSSAFDTFVFI